MNKLLFIFPADAALWADAMKFSSELFTFLDHEEFDSYWDEALYKTVRGKIAGADACSQGLRRLKIHDKFTDYSHLPALPRGTTVFYNDDDYSATIYGRRIAASGEAVLVKTSEENLPEQLAVWKDNVQQKPVSLAPVIEDFLSANDWFAQNRSPQRVFNRDARNPKHKDKEYESDGVTVSALSLPPDEIDYAIHHAVGAKGERRLAHYHPERNLVVIFSYENRRNEAQAPVYHGHQLRADDKKQVNRLPAELLKKLTRFGLHR